jgi:hypothetical protein
VKKTAPGVMSVRGWRGAVHELTADSVSVVAASLGPPPPPPPHQGPLCQDHEATKPVFMV